jgi:hypothetical protein
MSLLQIKKSSLGDCSDQEKKNQSKNKNADQKINAIINKSTSPPLSPKTGNGISVI